MGFQVGLRVWGSGFRVLGSIKFLLDPKSTYLHPRNHGGHVHLGLGVLFVSVPIVAALGF